MSIKKTPLALMVALAFQQSFNPAFAQTTLSPEAGVALPAVATPTLPTATDVAVSAVAMTTSPIITEAAASSVAATTLPAVATVTLPAVAEVASSTAAATLPEVMVQGEIESSYAPSFSTGATKSNAPLRDVPQTINVIPQKLILDQAARSLQDVLRNVPGVGMSNGDGQRDQVTIRGFSAISDQFVDGVRDDSLYFRDLSNIERIEVLKGPAAVLYGRGSSGGLINRITKKPQAGTFGDVTVNLGNNDLKRTSFDLNTSANEAIDLRLTGAFEDSGSFRDQGFNKRNSIAPSVSFKLTDATKLLVQGEFAKDERITDFGIPSFNGRPVNVNRGTYYGSGKAQRDDTNTTTMFSLTTVLDHRFNDVLSVRNATRYYNYDLDRNNTLPGGTVDTVTQTVGRSRGEIIRREDGYFNQTDFTFKNELGGVKQELLFGLELGQQNKYAQFASQANIDRVNIFNPNGQIAPPISAATLNSDAAIATDNVVKVTGVYLQNQMTLMPELKALLGIRYDTFKQDTEFARKLAPLSRVDKDWSPRAGLVWQPNEMASYYVSYSKSFQPSAESFGLAANNAGNEPEVTQNHEVGAKLDFFDGAFSVTGSVFNLARSNVKTADPAKPLVLINVGEQRTNGFELTASGRLSDGWDVSAGYAYLDAEFTKTNNVVSAPQTALPTAAAQIRVEGNSPSLTPQHSAFVWTTKALGHGFSVGGGLNYSANRFASTSNAVVLPGYVTADLAAYYSSKMFDASINLKNVTNKKYIVSGHGGNDNLITPGAPLEAQASLTYKF